MKFSDHRIGIASNRYQGDFKKVLCICSAGLLRSPTAAFVLSGEPFNYNTRSCGISEYALVKLSNILLMWAEEIVIMEPEHKRIIEKAGEEIGSFYRAKIICLNIPDRYAYRDPELIKLIINAYGETK